MVKENPCLLESRMKLILRSNSGETTLKQTLKQKQLVDGQEQQLEREMSRTDVWIT